jgi:hypothetical protein
MTKTFSNLQLAPGQENDFTLDPMMLTAGNNVLTIDLQNPNDTPDVNPADNSLSVNLVLNTSKDIIPIRQNFESDYSAWTVVSQGTQMKWVQTPINNNNSLAYNAFTNASLGDSAWLASPVLDFSKAMKASLFFDVSYATHSTGTERLRILSSGDCGVTFQNVLFNQTGDQFSATNSESLWIPRDSSDWSRKYVNLDALVGTGKVRLAFVVTNGHGNNLYLDNIEIFIDDNQNPVSVSPLYSVYNNYQTIFKITFNLPEKELVRLQIYNTLGQVVVDNLLPETLNQTYDVDLSGQQAGIYVVRLQIGSHLRTAKVFVPH